MAYRDRLHDSPPLLGHQQQPVRQGAKTQLEGSADRRQQEQEQEQQKQQHGWAESRIRQASALSPAGAKAAHPQLRGTQADAQMEALGSHLAVVPSSCGSVSLAL